MSASHAATDTDWAFASGSKDAEIDVARRPFTPSDSCTDSFEMVELEHVTQVAGDRVMHFDTNGSGLAVGDLDQDGWLDIVLANLDGPSTILWNQEGSGFARQELEDRSARGVATVDVDADGLLDVVMTHRGAGVSVWRNHPGSRADRFERGMLPGVTRHAYAMAWADLVGDAALDLVTASYDADLDRALGSAFLFSDGAGIVVYEANDGTYLPERLAKTSQGLSIATPDLNGDGRRDLVVGNDFNVRDRAWLSRKRGWKPHEPFERTSMNTMSLTEADIDNDGRPELFATDMQPYNIDSDTLDAWLPFLSGMQVSNDPADPQAMSNVLQVRDRKGAFREEAQARGLDATGWSWSAKFGDLDADGYVDLYAVNGMIDHETLGHLPDGTLTEENQVLRNRGDGTFEAQPEWGLGSSSSGRGMSLADIDEDGRLDIVVNNLEAPAQLFLNRLCASDALEVELAMPGSPNTHAVGARVLLRTDRGTLQRDVLAVSGYLSGDPTRVHFGVPRGAKVKALIIRWPDGARSRIPKPQTGAILTVTRQDQRRSVADAK